MQKSAAKDIELENDKPMLSDVVVFPPIPSIVQWNVFLIPILLNENVFSILYNLLPCQRSLNFDCKMNINEATSRNLFYNVNGLVNEAYPVVIFFGAKLVIFIARLIIFQYYTRRAFMSRFLCDAIRYAVSFIIMRI